METRDDAKRLGKLLVRIGNALNKKVGYVITLMDEPVGKSVGNILEIQETIKALNGNMSRDVEDTVISLAHVVLSLAYGEKDFETNSAKVRNVIWSGQALNKFKQMVIAQRWKFKLYR